MIDPVALSTAQGASPTLVFWTLALEKLPEILTAAGVFASILVGIWNKRSQDKQLEVVRQDTVVAAQKVETKVDANTAITAEIAHNVAVKAEETAIAVAQELASAQKVTDAKLLGLAETGTSTHLLVNSAMGLQKKQNALLARRVAQLTNDPEDALAADEAERLWAEHEKKQAAVDAKEAQQ